MPYEYNPLLKLNLQKKADLDPVEADIDDLKQKKVTKFFAATDTLEAGEIAQYQGPDDAVNGLKNGYFYNTSGQITIQTGTPFIEIPADIVGEFSTIKAGKYYLTDTQAITQLYYKYATDGNYNDYILYKEGSSNFPEVGDIVCKKAYTYNENSTYYKIASVSWVTGDTYDLTLTNGDALTITFSTAGGWFSYLHEFQNNDGKIFLYQKAATYTNWSPVLFCDTENNNAVIYAPYVTAGTTDTEVIISGGFAQVDTQPRVQGVENAQDGSLIITRDVQFSGDITVQGTQTVVKTQEIQSENDFIILREGNPLGLAAGAYSGFKIKNYDGNQNNCLLVVDKDGWARVGDEGGTVQKIATIQDNPTNGALVAYNSTSKQLESTTIPEATTTAAGLMSASDKSKLDGITPGGNFVKKFSDTEATSLNDGEVGQFQGTSAGDLTFGNFYKKTINYNTIPAGDNYINNSNAVDLGGFQISKGYYTPVETLAEDCYGWFKSEQYASGQWFMYTTFYPAIVGQKVCVTTRDTYQFVKFVEVATVEQASGQSWNIPASYSDGLNVQNQLAMTPRTNGKLRKYTNFDGLLMVLGVFPDTQGLPYVNVGFLYCGIDTNGIIWPLMSTAVAEKQAEAAINIPYTTLTQQDAQPQQLSVENNVVKYTLSDGITELNIAQLPGDVNTLLEGHLLGWNSITQQFETKTANGGKYDSFDGTTFSGKTILSCCISVTGGGYNFLYIAARQTDDGKLILYGYNTSNYSRDSVTLTDVTTSANAWSGIGASLSWAYLVYI